MNRTRSMLAAIYTQGGTNSFSVEEVATPEIDSDEMLLQIRAASICGTDVKIVRSGHRKLQDGQRIVLGHEFVGVIDQVGSRVEGFVPGQRVGVVPNAGCGRCEACMRGKANYCPVYTAFGIDRDGGHAGWVRIPSRFITQGNVMTLPAEISDSEASLLEPFSCVVNGVRSSRVELGDAVVVYGAGPIGLMHVMLCRAAGAGKLITIDVLAERLEHARALGSDVVLNPLEDDIVARVRQETGGQGANVVITACPAAEVQSQAVQLLAPFGRLCLFGGLPKTNGPVPLDTNAIHYGNFLVTGSTGGAAEDYRIAMRLVAGKRVDLSRVISNVFPLSRLQAAYDMALAGAEGKVVLVVD
ncbi:MAG: zinc-binding dehydrogenase [Pirellulaceae bacterium]